jgi:hypothetical protein
MSKIINNFKIALEYLWLAIFIALVIGGVHQTWASGIQESYTFFLFSLIAFYFFFTRRKQRLKSQN